MLSKDFTRIKLISRPPTSTVGGDEQTSLLRDFYSYSDTDYEYIIHRTVDPLSRRYRYQFLDKYHREEPSSKNNYYFEDGEDYRNFFDRENVIAEPPEDIDAFVTLFNTLLELLDSRMEWFFFSYFNQYHYQNIVIFYVLSFFFYFTEYTWPILWLYFPFISYFSADSLFGWTSFLEYHTFSFFFCIYIPFFIYFFFRVYYYSARWSNRFSFFRFLLVFFSVFSAFIFGPFLGIYIIFFAPIFIISFFFFSFYPYESSDIAGGDTRYPSPFIEYLISSPRYDRLISLPIFYYKYSGFCSLVKSTDNVTCAKSVKKLNFTSFPFFRVSSLAKHLVRVRKVTVFSLVTSVVPGARDGLSSSSEVREANGFLLEHLPYSFGYDAIDHAIFEYFPKFSNIDADAETDVRITEDYVVDFINTELGVSNISFFSADSYHRDILRSNYSSNLSHSGDYFDFFSPNAFSQRVKRAYGPYYELSLWLTLIKPRSYNGVDSFTLFPSSLIYKSPTTQKWYLNTDTHTFLPTLFVNFVTVFYALVEGFFLRITLYAYFSPRFETYNMLQNFGYFGKVFSRSNYYHSNMLKQLFKFIVFINKNYEFEKLAPNSDFFPLFDSIFIPVLKARNRLNGSLFRIFFKRRIRLINICLKRILITYKNFT